MQSLVTFCLSGFLLDFAYQATVAHTNEAGPLDSIIEQCLTDTQTAQDFNKCLGVEAPVPTQSKKGGLRTSNTLQCSIDGGASTTWFTKDEGKTFTLQNTPSNTSNFEWVGANADRHNVTSGMGQHFHYQDHRNGGGFTLYSLNDTKIIKCDKV